MTFKLTINPGGRSIPIEEHESILEAAIKQGYVLPYSCRDGVCGVCKNKIMEGRVDYGPHLASTLSDEEKAQGLALFCCAKPLSDLIVECKEVKGASDIPVKNLPCRVQKIERVAEDVIVLQLKLPASEKLEFLAGQYISIMPKNLPVKHFSLANAPHQTDFLELHIRNIPGGSFTNYVFNNLVEKDILRFKGPFGTFFLREDSNKPIIFVASGTGFAPIKSIIEHALFAGIKRPMHFYWGGRKLADLYMLDKAKHWETERIKFTPVLSEALASDHWTGRTGFVHLAVMEDYPDLSGYEVYVCGAPVVVEAAHRDFTAQCQLPADAFFSDAFTFTPPPAA